MNYTLTINVKNRYQYLSNATLDDVSFNIYYMGDSGMVYPTPISYGVYSVPEGKTIWINASKTGYNSGSGNTTLHGDSTYDMSLVPAYTARMNWYQQAYGQTAINEEFTATLYSKSGDNWTQVESNLVHNSSGTLWFCTTFDANTEYKIVCESSRFRTKEIEFTGAPTFSEMPYTQTTDSTFIFPTVINKITRESLTVVPTVQYEQVSSYQEYTGNWTAGYLNQSVNGYYLQRTPETYKCRIRITATLEGYEPFEYIEDLGSNTIADIPASYNYTAEMEPIPEYEISVTDTQTGSALTGYTATVSLNGQVVETSTTGKFYTALDGTSTYTLTVSKQGYADTVVTDTSFSGTVSLTPVYTVTFTRDPKNQYSNVTISNWSCEVYRYDGSTKVYATDLGDNSFEVVSGYEWLYVLSAPGYINGTEISLGTITQDVTVSTVIRLIPEVDARCRADTYTASNVTDRLYLPTTVLYKKVNDQWVTVETHVYETSSTTNYYIEKGTLEPNAEYKYVISSSTSYPIEFTFETDSEKVPTADAWGSNRYYYTHTRNTWLVKPAATDGISGAVVQPVYTVTLDSALEDIDYSDNWEDVAYTSNLGGYLIAGNEGYKYRIKIISALSGYYDDTTIVDIGTIDNPAVAMDTYAAAIQIYPVKQYAPMIVSVTDKVRGTALDATITVINNTTGETVEPVQGTYNLISNYGYSYTIRVSKTDYETETDVITPISTGSITEIIQLQKIYQYTDLYVTAKDTKGNTLSDAAVTVHNDDFDAEVPISSGKYPVIYNDGVTYTVTVSKDGYYTSVTQVRPTTATAIQHEVTLEKIPVYAPLYVFVRDEKTQETIDATVSVYDITTEEYIEPTGIFWKLLAEEDHEYKVEIEKEDYYDYESDPFTADTTDPIYLTCDIEHEPIYAPLTVIVKDEETDETIDATVNVICESTGDEIEKSEDGKYYLLIDDLYYKVYISKSGYIADESEAFKPTDTTPISLLFRLELKYEPFATVEELRNRTGIAYTAEQLERITYLLEDVSNLIRSEGRKCGVDVDAEIAKDKVYKSIVRTVTCDVTQRVLRQSQEGDAMTQESQSALGYTWSGTYAIPGGGIAMSLMRNEKDILGFNRQTIGVIELC